MNGNEVFRTAQGVKFNFSLYDYININKGANLPSLAGIGIGSLELTLSGLNRMTMLGSNGKFYPSNYKGRGWNFVSKVDNLGGAIKVLSAAGLIVDGVLTVPLAYSAIQSGDPMSGESGLLYKSLGLSVLAIKLPALGLAVGYLDFFASTEQGQKAIHQGLMERRQREIIKEDRIQLPTGPTYLNPKRQ